LLLTVGLISFIFPFLQSGQSELQGLEIAGVIRSLVALVLLFDVYVIYQQLQIYRWPSLSTTAINFATPLGHLDQAIAAHARGDWAAANGQSRCFLESLLDEIAYVLVRIRHEARTKGKHVERLLQNLQPPFLCVNLFEWGNQGKNLVNGVFKRLNPQGAHPGLSDEEDSTFRLHLVLLLGRVFLRRFDALPRHP
jgi:hypothetical protein